MKRLSTVRMKSVEDTTGNKQSREKSDVFYISLSGTTLNIMIFPVKSIFSQHFSSSSLAVILNIKFHNTG